MLSGFAVVAAAAVVVAGVAYLIVNEVRSASPWVDLYGELTSPTSESQDNNHGAGPWNLVSLPEFSWRIR